MYDGVGGRIGVVRGRRGGLSGRRRRKDVARRHAATYCVRHQRMPQEAAFAVPRGEPGVKRRHPEQRVQRAVGKYAAGPLSGAAKTRQYDNAVEDRCNRQRSSEVCQLPLHIIDCPNSDWILVGDIACIRTAEVTVYNEPPLSS